MDNITAQVNSLHAALIEADTRDNKKRIIGQMVTAMEPLTWDLGYEFANKFGLQEEMSDVTGTVRVSIWLTLFRLAGLDEVAPETDLSDVKNLVGYLRRAAYFQTMHAHQKPLLLDRHDVYRVEKAKRLLAEEGVTSATAQQVADRANELRLPNARILTADNIAAGFRAELPTGEPTEEIGTPDFSPDVLVAEQHKMLVAKALDALTTDERIVVILTQLEDLDQEEASRKIGISRRTLVRRLGSAREKMAAALAGYDVADLVA